MDDAELLAVFDRQVRQRLVPPEPGWVTERVGQVVRTTAGVDATWGSFIEWSDLDEADADAEIAAQVGYFARLGRCVEWKTYGYDLPADLPRRLLAAGFVAEAEESLVVGPTDLVVAACSSAEPPAGVVVAEAGPLDWAGIGALQDAVWGDGGDSLVGRLTRELAANPQTLVVLVARAGETVVSAGWVRFLEGTDFASLWGGSTLPGWRRRGVYRALVSRRAALAQDRGYRYLQVDASPDSRPVLERLGLRVLTTTTPYVWSPP